jgi:hypothetical protein
MAWVLPMSLPAFEFGLAYIAPIDGTHIRVIFSEAVVVSEALTTSNYVISIPGRGGGGGGGHGLSTPTVISVAQETDLTFILTTTPQDVGQTYSLTVSGIYSLNGDLI